MNCDDYIDLTKEEYHELAWQDKTDNIKADSMVSFMPEYFGLSIPVREK